MTTTTERAAGVVIHRAGPERAETIMDLACEIAAHEGQLAHLSVTAQRWQEVLSRPDVIVLVAERSGTPVGYVSAVRRLHLWSEKDVLALDDLYVREHARGTGVGEALMTELAATYAAPDQLTVTWGVEPDNSGAQRFYRRLGATLRDKVVAGWTPQEYLALTGARAPS